MDKKGRRRRYQVQSLYPLTPREVKAIALAGSRPPPTSDVDRRRDHTHRLRDVDLVAEASPWSRWLTRILLTVTFIVVILSAYITLWLWRFRDLPGWPLPWP